MRCKVSHESHSNVSFFYPPPAASGLAVSVGLVGPLSLGENELLHTVAPGGEEDLDISALMETRGLICRPTSIISFNSQCGSVTALPSGSQPITVISGAVEDGAVEDYYMPAGLPATPGVTEVVAMAEVSVTVFDLHLHYLVRHMLFWIARCHI